MNRRTEFHYIKKAIQNNKEYAFDFRIKLSTSSQNIRLKAFLDGRIEMGIS